MHEPPLQRPDLAAARGQPAARRREEPRFEPAIPRRPLVRVGHHRLRRRRGRRRAQVRHEIGDGEVDLVPDPADDGNRRAVHRARHHFLVEGPEILERSSAAGHDQHVALGALAGRVDHARDRLRRPGALDRHRVEHHRHRGESPSQHAQDVAYRRTGGRSNDPDAPRQERKRVLVFRVEQAFRAEPALQRIERAPQRPGARFLHVLHDELELAALGVEADLRVGEHLHAVCGRESQRPVVHAEHRAPHLAALVLEREVDVPRARTREIGYLALDPDGRERLLENRTGVEVEARHGVDVTGEGVRGGGQARIGHAVMLPRPAGNDKSAERARADAVRSRRAPSPVPRPPSPVPVPRSPSPSPVPRSRSPFPVPRPPSPVPRPPSPVPRPPSPVPRPPVPRPCRAWTPGRRSARRVRGRGGRSAPACRARLTYPGGSDTRAPDARPGSGFNPSRTRAKPRRTEP